MNAFDVQFVHTLEKSEYNALRKSVGWPELPDRQAAASLNNSAFFVAARHEGKAIGMTRVVGDGGYIAYIADVIVMPEYQGQGIGKTMVDMAMQFISDSMSEGETVFVNLMAAKGKEPFYSKFGFAERPNETHGAGMTQYLKK
jgi:GNAT superfamily N-acetyltransferase